MNENKQNQKLNAVQEKVKIFSVINEGKLTENSAGDSFNAGVQRWNETHLSSTNQFQSMSRVQSVKTITTSSTSKITTNSKISDISNTLNVFDEDPKSIKIIDTISDVKKLTLNERSSTFTTSGTDFYDTTHPKTGIALIFNHENIKGKTPRDGTNEDSERLKETLEKYQFDVRVYKDLRYSEIITILQKTAKEDHSDNDCIFIAVMTHGDEGVVFASDIKYSVNELWEEFIGDNCKTLIGKPKIILIQACRGHRIDDGVDYQAKSGKDFVDASEEEPIIYRIPQMADLLVMYSTVEGHSSFRNPTLGSWFMQAFCDEVEQYGYTKDLLWLLTGVNHRVAFLYSSFMPKSRCTKYIKQMPCITSMLTKIFILKWKN